MGWNGWREEKKSRDVKMHHKIPLKSHFWDKKTTFFFAGGRIKGGVHFCSEFSEIKGQKNFFHVCQKQKDVYDRKEEKSYMQLPTNSWHLKSESKREW